MSFFITLAMFLQLLLHMAASLPFTTAHHQNLISRNELAISTDGLCGGAVNATCFNSVFGDSCSFWGFCGSYYKAEFAGTGCQADFGVCNAELISTTTTVSTTSSPVRLIAASISSSGIVIVPITTMVTITTTYGFQSPLTMTTTTPSQAPIQTAHPKFGFCGVSGSNCAR